MQDIWKFKEEWMSKIEDVKKAKAPAKSAKAAAPKGAAPKAVAAKAAAPKAAKASPALAVPTREDIARLAEQYWIERGWQDGYAEQDWLRAERELMAS
jgi:hypothetical protein